MQVRASGSGRGEGREGATARAEPRLSFLWLVPVAVTLILFTVRYEGPGSSQWPYLLQPLREIIPDFCPGDWFVWEVAHYHHTFSALIRLLDVVFLGHLHLGQFVAWAFGIFFLLHALFFLTRRSGGGFEEFTLAVLATAVYSPTSLGFSFVLLGDLVATNLAFVLLLYALGLLIDGRRAAAFFVLGLAALLHVHFGVLGAPLFLAFVLIQDRRPRWRRLAACALAFALPALPSLVDLAWRMLTDSASGSLTVDALMLSNPHHYDPRTWGAQRWSTLGLPVALAAGWLLLARRRTTREEKALGIWIALIAGMLVISGLSAVLDGPRVLIRLFPWRFAPLLLILSVLVLGRGLFEPRPGRRTLALAAAPLLALRYAWVLRSEPAAAAVFVGLLCASAAVLALGRARGWHPAAALGVCMLALVVGNGATRASLVPSPQLPAVSPAPNPFFSWMRDRSPKDALFLSPPDLSRMRYLGHRAIVVDWLCLPQGRQSDVREWIRRLERVTGVPSFWALPRGSRRAQRVLRNHYLRRTPEQVRAVMEEFGATHFVTYPEHEGLAAFRSSGSFELVYRDRRVRVFRLERLPPSPRSPGETG